MTCVVARLTDAARKQSIPIRDDPDGAMPFLRGCADAAEMLQGRIRVWCVTLQCAVIVDLIAMLWLLARDSDTAWGLPA